VIASVRAGPVGFAQSLALGTAPTSSMLILPELHRRFRTCFPDATLVMREGISTFLEEWLLERRIDVSLLHCETPFDGITLIPLLRERMVIAMRSEDRSNCPQGAMAFRDRSGVSLLLASVPHSNCRLIKRLALQRNLPLNVVIEVNSVALIEAAVRAGAGATIQTYAGVAADIARGRLAMVEITEPQIVSYI